MTRRKIICKIIIRLADIQGSCRVCFSMKLAFEDLMPIAEPEWNYGRNYEAYKILPK